MRWSSVGILTAVMFLPVFLFTAAYSQQDYTDSEQPRITVSGEAVVRVIPDRITVNFGIETWNLEIMTAKEQNNDILRKALAAIEGCGVPAGEIQTDHLSIEPRWEDGYRKHDFLGYFVRNAIVVTVTDPAVIEEIVTKTLQAGVNYIHGIDFQTTEYQRYREEARELALRAASEKAEKMASALGRRIGEAVRIQESYTGRPWRYYSSWWGWGYGARQGMNQNVIQTVPDGTGEMTETIALGKISIRAGVSVPLS